MKALCPICGGDGVPVAPTRGASRDLASRISGSCPDCGATVSELQGAARATSSEMSLSPRRLSLGQSLLTYLGIIVGCVVFAFVGEALTGVAGQRLVITALGLVFLLAAIGNPGLSSRQCATWTGSATSRTTVPCASC